MPLHLASFPGVALSASRPAALLLFAIVSACASTVGGVAGGSVVTATPNAYCNPTGQPDACGSTGTTPARLHCDEVLQRWMIIDVCASGLACWEAPDPANSAHKATACWLAPQTAGSDAGATDSAGDATATDVGGTDSAGDVTGTNGGDGGSPDGSDGDVGPSVDATPSSCGDGACDDDETADTCPLDCICGDGVCKGTETAQSCQADCPAVCGDKACTPPEDSAKCPEDCVASVCPATCEAGKYCNPATGDCITPTCAMPDLWSVDVQKIASWAVSPAGEGCDLNGDGTPDNQMAKILQFEKDANKALQSDLVSGKSVTLFEAKQWNAAGTAFTIGLLRGKLDPIDAGCNLVSNSGNCAYQLFAANYAVASTEAACPVKATLSSTVNGMDLLGTFTGKPVLPVPMLNVPVDVPFALAQVSGTVVGPATWTVTIDGRLCGAVTKFDLGAAFDKLPEDAFPGVGAKAMAKALIINALTPDIDTDGDGVADAISASFDFGTVPGIITGIAP